MRSAFLVAAMASWLFGPIFLTQEVSGSLRGRVVTSSGEPAPGAKATLSGRDLLDRESRRRIATAISKPFLCHRVHTPCVSLDWDHCRS